MNSTICSNAEINTTGQLTDLRDGKQYWVSKLQDGNCWMVQNLDFDIPATLSSSTSNVAEANVQTNTVKVSAPAEWTSTSSTYNAYYDPGDYYYNGPNGTHTQGAKCNTTVGLSECVNSNGQWSASGDSHYHVGNYYSWSAATVKSGNNLSTNGDNALSSICPAGWQLPKSGTDTPSTTAPWNYNGTFAHLFESYGWKWDETYRTSNLNGGTSYYIYNAPFYFTYGGLINSTDGLGYISSYGTYWTSTVYSDTRTFRLVFTSITNPADDFNRLNGFSVRCIAK